MHATLWEWLDHVMQWKQSDKIYKQICKQIYKAYTWWIYTQIYKMWWIYKVIYRSTDQRSTAQKLQTIHNCQTRNWDRDCQMMNTDRDHPGILKHRNYKHSGQMWIQTEITIQAFYTEYWDSEQQKGFNWSQYWIQTQTESTARSTHESAGCVRSTAESTRSVRSTGSAGSTTWSATRSTPTVTVKVRKQPPVANSEDSISHANFRSNFPTPDKRETAMEKKQMRQLQDRGIHNHTFRQRDSDLQTDL